MIQDTAKMDRDKARLELLIAKQRVRIEQTEQNIQKLLKLKESQTKHLHRLGNELLESQNFSLL